MNAPRDIRQRYLRFAETECRGYSDLYDALARAVAEDDAIVAFLARQPVVQPNLFLAAIQLLTGPDGMPRSGPELRAFVMKRGEDVGQVMRSHRTQTNEVGRCAVLLPALPPGPLALVEVGASAGLCLLLDRFQYELGSTHIGPASAPVHLHCRAAGSVPLPLVIPTIVWRAGLDLHPLDVHDDAAVRWLLACVWADHAERRRRLEAAIDVARAVSPLVRTGDLVDDLPALLAEAPEGGQLVVFHSAVLSYVTPDRRRTFAEVLAEVSEQRDVVWLSNEAAGIIPEIAALSRGMVDGRFLLGRTHFRNGCRRDELLALAHPHGSDLVWL